MVIDEPIGRFDRATGLWMLTSPWSIPMPDGRTMRCYPGALSDGVSVGLLQSAFTPRFEMPTFKYGFGHDCLYRAQLISRHESDYAFYWWMKNDSLVKGWKRYGYYAAVRSFGWKPWRDNRPRVLSARRYVEINGPVSPIDPVVLQQLEATA